MSNLLTELSNGFAAVAETASASMVRVEGRRQQAATGIIWSVDGLIVTADHVLRTNDKVVVGLPDGQTVEARLVGREHLPDRGHIERLAADDDRIDTGKNMR